MKPRSQFRLNGIVFAVLIFTFSILNYTSASNPNCEGDLNYDYVVNEADMDLFAGDFGHSDCTTGYPCIADFDGDGDVDGNDFSRILALFGTDCTLLDRICNGALSYDSGIPAWHYAVNENYGIAVKFTPTTYPWTFNAVQFWPWSNSTGLDFEVHVWDDDGPGGMPGSELITPVGHQATHTDEWENVPLPDITINDGEFYIGWVQKTTNLYYNGSDDASTYNGRSYLRSLDGSWSNFGEIGSDANMMIRQSCRSFPPSLSNLQVNPSLLPVPYDDEYFMLTVSFDFEDPDGDLYALLINVTDPGGISQGGAESFQTLQTEGSAETDLLIDSSYLPGEYEISLTLEDEFGNRSGTEIVTFTIQVSAVRPIEITSLSTHVGNVGDLIEISGFGFKEEEPSTNLVYFGDSLQRAEVVSATATFLEVIIPEGALSGPVKIRLPSGETQSLDSFTIQPLVTLSPDLDQMMINQTIEFECTRSGLDTSGVEWTVNGQTVPDPALGTIDQFGSYTSPSNLPLENPVIIRCADADYPSYYAEVELEIISPTPQPGEGTVLAQTGGEIESENGEVVLNIPAAALGDDTLIGIEPLTEDIQPVLNENAETLAAVQLEPSGLQFNGPVDMTFTLKSWQPPETEIPLAILEDGGELTDTGKAAVVDLTGLKATAQIDHFSRYLLQRNLIISREPMAQRWEAFALQFSEYELEIPPELSFIEGLSVPVLIKRRAGKGSGPGPFFAGVTVTAVLEGYTRDTTPLEVELVQPNADGWQLGTIIHIPTLTQLGEGEVAGAVLYIDYPAQAGSSGTETMQFDIDIECLNELIFNYDRPAQLPDGAVQYVSQGRRYVRMPRKGYYRFSEIHVGQQAVLEVQKVWAVSGDPRDPLILSVTGDITIEGLVDATGTDGEGGANGSGSDNGGSGGTGGKLAAGAGGIGGPTSPTKYDRDGRDALYQPYGGKGGMHGYKWDNASWISVLISSAEIWYHLGEIAFCPADLWNYVELVESFYGGVQETIKYNRKDQNRVRSAGEGGKRGGPTLEEWITYGTFEPSFPVPMAGGGGGGSGKMRISGEPDAAGAGGGGGGGAGANVKMISGGNIFFAQTAGFSGHGGDGGRGGNGSTHSWTNQAAPGAGGAGGSGANLHMIASRGFINNGGIGLRGGAGSLGGEIDDGDGIILLPKTFGERGLSGGIRLDGKLTGSSPSYPMYRGVYMGTKIISTDRWGRTSANFEDTIYLGIGGSGISYILVNGVEIGPTPGLWYQNVLFPLTEGLNTLAIKQAIHGEAGIYATQHPWMYQYVFCFPGLEDNDSDGLPNGLEAHINSDANDMDSDGDGLSDGDEVLVYQTDPASLDTDGDGYSDPEEFYVGTDPTDPNDHPGIDTDNDGLPDGWENKHFGNLSLDANDNPDDDGLRNDQEYQLHTDPNIWDTDEDGVSDGEEVFFNSDPLDSDSTPEGPGYSPASCDNIDNDLDGEIDEGFPNNDGDGLKDCVDPDDDNDGLSDVEENSLGTNPFDSDTDDDNLSDYVEVQVHGTNPLIADSDGDGLNDGDEVVVHHTLPLDADSDDDGLTDGEEVNIYETDPLIADTDEDGITDYDEVTVHGTDPLKKDTDGDGYDDLLEINSGTDPRNPDDYPGAGDIDDDGLPDQWEIEHFGNLDQGPDDDFDDDFLNNLAELNLETNPTLADTDGDGAWDNVEIDQGSDPLNQNSTPEICDGNDNDIDGLTDEEGVCETHLDNKGQEFFLAFMPTIDDAHPSPYNYLYISSQEPAQVTVQYPVNNPTYTKTYSLSYNENIRVDPVDSLPAETSTAWTSGTAANNAIRVTSTSDISIVMKNSASYEPDQALALPLETLGTEYIIMSYDPSDQWYNSEFVVVATQDDTTVFIDPIHLTYSPYFITLDRGEGYLVTFTRYPVKRTIVTSDKPIAVSNGNKCTSVPEYTRYCEHLFEMAVPVNHWETEVLAINHPRYFAGFRRSYYHIVASQDDTNVLLNGLPVAALNRGQLQEVIRESSDYVNHFTADKPIFIVQYMNSVCDEFPESETCFNINEWPASGETGDASMANLIHVGQYPRKYDFYAGGSTRLSVVAHTEDVENGRLLLDGVPVDPNDFSVFPTAPDYSFGVLRMLSGGNHTSQSVNGHTITLMHHGFNTAYSNPLGIQFQE